MALQETDPLAPGQRLPEISLWAPDGSRVRVGDYYDRSNLVLLCVGSNRIACLEILLTEMASDLAAFKAENAKILLILAGTQAQAGSAQNWMNLPFQILADPDGDAQRRLGVSKAGGPMGAAVCVADRFGEVVFSWRDGQGHPQPASSDLLACLRSTEQQCPE